MDAARALVDLTSTSSQIAHAAIVEGDSILATTIEDPERSEQFARGTSKLLEEARAVGARQGEPAEIARFEVATLEGSVFVVCRNGRTIAAATHPDPTVGLVFYDLEHCLRTLEKARSSRKGTTRKRTAKKSDAAS